MYYDYLISEAIKNNEIKNFLTGEGKYKEKETPYGEIFVTDYEARLRYLCNYQTSEKKAFDTYVANLILNFLNGSIEEFFTGICYIRTMCYLSNDSIKLQIDNKAFFETARNIILKRKLDLQRQKYKDDNFNNMWDFVEYNDKIIQDNSGIKII